MLELYKAIDAIHDKLVADGVELPDALKRRDPREPGRVMKEMYEDKLIRLLKRRFRFQKKRIKEHLQMVLPPKFGASDYVNTMPDDLLNDPDTEKKLLQIFLAASEDGVNLFAENSTIALDWTLVNTQAADWARKYTGKLLSDLDDVTIKALRSRLGMFVEQSGYTIADVMSDMVGTLGEARAQRIAITETTRAFGRAEQIAGEQMKKEYPDIRVVKEWFTNVDDRVCPICAPLQNMTIEINESFPGGIMEPPAHVNCRCWMVSGPRLPEEDEVEDMPEWSPSMSRAEAERWAAGSAYRNDFYHGTTLRGMSSIPIDGFNTGIVNNGRLFGNGVYLTPNQTYAGGYGVDGGTLTLKASVNNVFSSTMGDQSGKWLGMTYDAKNWYADAIGGFVDEAEAITEYLKHKGYDAFALMQEGGNIIDTFLVFDPKNLTVIK